jgi:hypothetical protein
MQVRRYPYRDRAVPLAGDVVLLDWALPMTDGRVLGAQDTANV